MQYSAGKISGVMVITPEVFGDHRGYFFESFRSSEFGQKVGECTFVQENQSRSTKGVVRGLHFQRGQAAQSKLVKVAVGRIRDVVVDLRKESPSFGMWEAIELSDQNHKQLYIPKGCAHGFAVLSETAVVQYKCDAYYAPEYEDGVLWNDPTLSIDWGVEPQSVQISDKDLRWPSFEECYKF